MTEYVKMIRSDISDFLLSKYPNAFLLLCLIAKRARREDGLPDGLRVGDAMIGDFKAAGLTRQKYRRALEKLVELGIVQIVSNSKKYFEYRDNNETTLRQIEKTTIKSTIKTTIKGTLVNLKDSRIFDINPKPNNHQLNHQLNQQATIKQPSSNHEEEGIRKNKKEERKEKNIASTPNKSGRKQETIFFSHEKGEFEGITEKDLQSWAIAYPSINLEQHIAKASQWLIANPSKAKKSRWRQYLTGWFGREQERAETRKLYASQSAGDRRRKEPNGTPINIKELF